MKVVHLSLIASCLAMAFGAQATTINIYGRTDAGIMLENLKGSQTTYQLRSGGRSAPRIGITVVEPLPNGMEAKVYLENGFKMDTGEFSTKDTLFDRRSILALKGNWGELGAGRAGTIQSTMSPYSMGSIKWDPFGTSYGFASVGSTFANTGRTDNGLFYHSPSFNGVKFGLSYSFANSGEEPDEWNDADHTFAMGLNYSNADMWVGVTYANVQTKRVANASTPNANLVQVGGWYRFPGNVRLFVGAGYQNKFASAAKMTRKFINANGVSVSDTFNGTSWLLGGDWTNGAHKLMWDVQYFRGKAQALEDTKLTRAVYSLAYEYYLRKNVILYTAINRSKVGGDYTKDDYKYDGTQFFAGLNYNF